MINYYFQYKFPVFQYHSIFILLDRFRLVFVVLYAHGLYHSLSIEQKFIHCCIEHEVHLLNHLWRHKFHGNGSSGGLTTNKLLRKSPEKFEPPIEWKHPLKLPNILRSISYETPAIPFTLAQAFRQGLQTRGYSEHSHRRSNPYYCVRCRCGSLLR